MKPIEIQQNFHNELKQLLLKYKAEICLEQFETRYLPEEKIVKAAIKLYKKLIKNIV